MKLKKMNLLFILVPLLLIALFKLYPVLIAIVESFLPGELVRTEFLVASLTMPICFQIRCFGNL